MSFQFKHGLFQFDIIDYYAILGVSLDAETKEIRQRYLRIAQKLHPDTCKAKDERTKQQASQILSKLVNPAYEQLSKPKSRTEFLIVLSQVKQRLAAEKITDIKLVSEVAKDLSQGDQNVTDKYHQLLKNLAANQYNQSLEQITPKIIQISELNLVYLKLKPEKGTAKPKRAIASTTVTREKSTQTNAPQKTTAEISPIAACIKRGQQNLQQNNFAQTILEMRDALKIEPNNPICHGLMGLAYLKQNQLTMAKVHINKAWQSNSQDPLVTQAKQELDQALAPERSDQNDQAESPRSGFFGGLFGGKKK